MERLTAYVLYYIAAYIPIAKVRDTTPFFDNMQENKYSLSQILYKHITKLTACKYLKS